MSITRNGTYRHYKGGLYEVIGTGKNQNLEDTVIYRALQKSEFGDRAMWVRSVKEFGDQVTVDGKQMARYRYLGPSPKPPLIGKLLAVAYFDLLLIFTCAILLLGIFVITRDFRDPGFFFADHYVLGWIITVIFSVAIFGLGYARFVGPWWLRTRYYNVVSPTVTNPLHIAIIADLQVGDHKRTRWMEKVVNRIIATKPDLVLIAGDLISNELNPEDESSYLEPLRALVGKIPTFAVLGNHDYGLGLLSGGVAIHTQDKSDLVMQRFVSMGIPLLKNGLSTVTIKNQTYAVYGIDDEWGGKPDYHDLMNWNKEQPIILLAHNPDAIIAWPKELPKPILAVAGHTHGGQMKIPFLGPIGDAYLKLPKTFYSGVHDYQGTPVFVTTGVGESLGPLRIGTPPEVAVVTLSDKKIGKKK